MLNYLITVIDDLLITVTLLVLIWELCRAVYDRYSVRILGIGIGVGIAASAAMALTKNLTSKVATNRWNLWIFLFTTVVSLLFVIFSCVFKNGKGRAVVLPFGAAVLAALLFYELPDVMAYPFLFDTGKSGRLSVAFLLRFLGWLGALLLLLIYAVYLRKCIRALNRRSLLRIVTNVAVLVNACRCAGQSLRPWVSRAKWLPDFLPKYSKADFPWAFPVVKFVANGTLLFSVIIAGLALVLVITLFIYNMKIHGTYDNPAQLRRLKANAKRCRRQAVTVVVCFCACVLILTVVKAYTNRTIELSSPEEYVVDGNEVRVPLSQVEDGHLHRFEYTTDNKIAVRWIVIKKPGSAAYGVGLDACDVCGDAGYYERGDQVVCKRCDVVMNIQTIGFKGGCNPIPMSYVVRDGQMIFDLQEIIAGEKEFK
ncbi:MAG: Fe-S-containing protein [Eubacteriales bacterium]|nr:Fe-S-containing protein [Eubacteriales bacterium]